MNSKTKLLAKLSSLPLFLILIFISLNSFFYSGFVQKHFFINLSSLIFFYLIFAILLSLFKLHPFSPKILKLNRLFLPITTLISLSLIYLEETNFPNFIFSHLHLNPQILFYFPLISLTIFLFHDFKWTSPKTLLIIIPLISTYLSQYITFNKFFDFKLLDFNFLVYNLTNFKTIIINYLLWLSLLIFLIGIFKKKYQSFIAYLSFFFLFSLVNRYKSNMLGTPFTLNDFHLIGDLIKFFPSLIEDNNFKKGLIVAIFGLGGIYFLFKKIFNQNNPSIKNKIILIILPILLFSFPVLFSVQYQQITQKIKIENYLPNPIDSCRVNGVFFCFYNNLRNIRTLPPKNYNQEKINQIYSNLNITSSKTNQTNKPNIIIILSEAFWDPTNLSQVKYSSDPIPNVRKDIKSTFISPSFGGGTANVEFELITGFSNYFFNNVSPYSQSIKQSIPSLFSLFKDKGYFTTVIHPYYKSAYNRPNVYRYFGLDKYTTIEDMNDPQYAGPYVSDAYFNQQIVDQLNSTDQPQLIYGISMQNHVVFNPNRYSEHPISIQSNLDNNDQSILQSYVDGLHLTDSDYLQLKQTLSQIKKPTIVIFFGDHLTSLGNGVDIYQKVGFDTNNETKMHSTLIATWSNFNQKFNLPTQVSPNFLSLEILKLANIEPKYQFLFLDSLKNTDLTLNKKIPTKLTPEQLTDYQLIQYDLIFGKQYGLKVSDQY